MGLTALDMDETPEPKRRNAAKTRAKILATAYDCFARHGYAKTGMREIAKQSGAAASLLTRYFGTKANLFEEALIHAIYTSAIFTKERDRFGVRMAKLLGDEEDSGIASKLTVMMVLAIADPESEEVARKVVAKHVLEPLADWLGPPHAMSRAINMVSLMNAFSIETRHLASSPVSRQSLRWFARVLQDIVDQGKV